MSKLSAIADYGTSSSWLIWIMIIAFLLVFGLGWFVYSLVAGGSAPDAATNITSQILENTTLPF